MTFLSPNQQHQFKALKAHDCHKTNTVSQSKLRLQKQPSLSLVTPSFGCSPTSILNITTFGVIVDILLLKQYLYTPSEWAANVYLPLASRLPAYMFFPSGPEIYKYSTTFPNVENRVVDVNRLQTSRGVLRKHYKISWNSTNYRSDWRFTY